MYPKYFINTEIDNEETTIVCNGNEEFEQVMESIDYLYESIQRVNEPFGIRENIVYT